MMRSDVKENERGEEEAERGRKASGAVFNLISLRKHLVVSLEFLKKVRA
jgi:hypothetical protein